MASKLGDLDKRMTQIRVALLFRFDTKQFPGVSHDTTYDCIKIGNGILIRACQIDKYGNPQQVIDPREAVSRADGPLKDGFVLSFADKGREKYEKVIGGYDDFDECVIAAVAAYTVYRTFCG